MSKEETAQETQGRKRARFRIRYLITALMIGVFLVFGAIALVLLFGSQNRMVQKSKNELIKTMCEDSSSSIQSLIPFMQQAFIANMSGSTAEDLGKILAHQLTNAQKVIDAELKKFVDNKVMRMRYIMVISKPGSAFVPGVMVEVSSDESQVYKWKPPDDVVDAMVSGKKYIYKENGIPELGIKKNGLYVIEPLPDPNEPNKASNSVVAAKSIEKQVADINAFVNHEQKITGLIFTLVILGCLLLVILITFFILSYLIRTRITEPIDKLAATADDVMQGNLDADIEVHEGGDFESLERTFKEMVVSIRIMVEKATGGDQ